MSQQLLGESLMRLGSPAPVMEKAALGRACEQEHCDQGTQTRMWRVWQFVQYFAWKDVGEELCTLLVDHASSSNSCLEGTVGTGLRIKVEF